MLNVSFSHFYLCLGVSVVHVSWRSPLAPINFHLFFLWAAPEIRVNSRNSRLNSPIPQHLTHFPLAANFAISPPLLKSPWLGNRPAAMSQHAHIRVLPRTAHPTTPARKNSLSRPRASFGRFGLIRPTIPPLRLRVSAVGPIGFIPSHPPANPQKTLKFNHQNLRKPQQNPPS
jgi:hypothetical protein